MYMKPASSLLGACMHDLPHCTGGTKNFTTNHPTTPQPLTQVLQLVLVKAQACRRFLCRTLLRSWTRHAAPAQRTAPYTCDRHTCWRQTCDTVRQDLK